VSSRPVTKFARRPGAFRLSRMRWRSTSPSGTHAPPQRYRAKLRGYSDPRSRCFASTASRHWLAIAMRDRDAILARRTSRRRWRRPRRTPLDRARLVAIKR
jgi:hypothetical protein